jgi:3-hydroxybutyryl-CoA dehydrogenase
MTVHVTFHGESRSFPDGAPELGGEGVLLAGSKAGAALASAVDEAAAFIAVELGEECLGVHLGLDPGPAFANVVGFARFRIGDGQPGQLIELVTLPGTRAVAIAAARAAFEQAGFTVARCADTPGRIVNRLIRPYLNAVLRRLDDGLASAEDMDTTLRLGLGYPEGPNALLARSGLHHHFDVSQALYEALGDPDFAPARRARIARIRASS